MMNIPDTTHTQELIQEQEETDREEIEVVEALQPPEPDPVSAPTLRKSTRKRTVPDRLVVGMNRAEIGDLISDGRGNDKRRSTIIGRRVILMLVRAKTLIRV
eukprot:sb/3478367/